MATNPNWPLTITSVALTTDPFDGAAVPTYTDISTRVTQFAAAVGRQYELDTIQAGEASFTVTDKDEAFNPTNPSSPDAGTILPYRQIRDQAMWPPTPTGGAVNLLVGQLSPAIDPTFESYTAATTPTWVTAVGATTPTVGTTTPHAGTKDLTWTVAATATAQGVSWPATCIPGQQYTASAFIRQTSASTQRIQILNNDGSVLATGSSTATTAAYVRLSCTFTATQPVHTVRVATTGTAVAGTVLLDDLQHETGASASTFSSAAGPVIYGNFGGFVERWPSKWNHQGMYGMAEITAVDGFAILSGQNLSTEYRNAVMAKSPDLYWPLSEPSGSTSFAEVSGNGGPPLVFDVSKYGAGTAPAGGTTMNIAGDPSGTGVTIAPGNPASPTQVATLIGTGPIVANTTAITFPALIGTSWAATVSAWVVSTNSGVGDQVLLRAFTLFSADVNNAMSYVPIEIDLVAPALVVENVSGGVDFLAFANSSVALADGKLHHVVGTVTQVSGGNTTLNIWVDGVNRGSTLVTTTGSLGGMLGRSATNLIIGGWDDTSSFDSIINGPVAHVALWNRALSNTEIADLWSAGKGYPGETSGARITRYLGYNWVGPTAIDTGSSTMGVSDLADNTAILDAVLNVALAEGGVAFPDDTGTITFQGRSRRFTATTAKWSLGEAESPYEADIAYDYDPTLVFNDPEVTRSAGSTGGITAVGGTLAARQASWKRYGKRSYTITINLASDLETQDRANWVFYTHKDPQQRIAALTLKPSANPALWPVCLGMQIGDRATVKRRTTAGYTMSSDYFVERIEQRRAPNEWTFTLQLSPASATGQPWILGDATYGVLGSTTILGY